MAARGSLVLAVLVVAVVGRAVRLIAGIAILGVAVPVVLAGLLAASPDTQLSPQPVKVGTTAAIFELAGDLYLLGLGSAAPHWLDPLEHRGPGRPLITAARLRLRCQLLGTTKRPRRPERCAVRPFVHI
jgi:hypothetical protein